MVADIVLMPMKMYRSLKKANCSYRRAIPAVIFKNQQTLPLLKKEGQQHKDVNNDLILNFRFMKKSGKKNADQLPAILPGGRPKTSSFFEDVFEVVRQIPRGRITSYGAIAFYLGSKSSARMVGWAMNASFHCKPKVPAHRVVNRNGMLSGKAHFAPPELMQQLLEKEGIQVKEDTIVDFEKKFWDPAVELSIE